MLTAILFILMLLILVIPHELGHFIMAKINHVQVNEFSVGMGPLIYQKQKGETMYSIRLLPLGGYCAMEGEDEESNNPRAFSNKSAVQKISVLLAGVMMNVLIALIIISCVMFKSGVPTNVLASVDVDSPAMQAGLLAGDEIVSIEGQETGNWTDTIVRLSHYDGKDTIEVTVKRDGAIKNFNITPTYDTEREQYVIGIVSAVSKNPLKVIPYSITYTKNLNTAIIKSFVMLFTGKLSKDDVSGPVGMVKIVNSTKSYGIETYLMLIAIVSLNLAIFNIIPFPALDGGRVLFVLIRAITGNAISDELEGTFHVVGFLLLIGLFIFITINDVINLF